MATRRSFELFLLSSAFLGLTVVACVYARRVVVDPSGIVAMGVRPGSVVNIMGIAAFCAFAVAVTAWIRHPLLPWAITAWGVCVGALMIEFQNGQGVRGEPLWLLAFPYLMLALLIWLLVRFAGNRV